MILILYNKNEVNNIDREREYGSNILFVATNIDKKLVFEAFNYYGKYVCYIYELFPDDGMRRIPFKTLKELHDYFNQLVKIKNCRILTEQEMNLI